MHAIRVDQPGGPEQLRPVELEAPQPQRGEVLVAVEAAGVNYIDIYQRQGVYNVGTPYTPGMEAAGIVVALGEDAVGFNVGDRVAYSSQLGAYAQLAAVPTTKLVGVPEGVASDVAAAAMLQGMTAQFLSHSTYPIRRGDHVLIHAAAGGVGLLLVQMAKQRGATVYGTTSTEEKAALVRAAGADEVILYTEQDFTAEVRRLTDGRGVQVVYDSVGKTTFDGSLNSLAPQGYLVLFGQASGPVPPLDPQVLNAKGSLFLTRPSLFHYAATPADLQMRAGAVFDMIAAGTLDLRIDRRLPLADAAEAHTLLASRGTSGKLLLIPPQLS